MKKKILSALLAIAMLVAVIPAIALPTAAAAANNPADGYDTTVTADVLTVDGLCDDAYLRSEKIVSNYKSATNADNDFVAYTAANAQGLYVWVSVVDTDIAHRNDRLAVYYNFRAVHTTDGTDTLTDAYMVINFRPLDASPFAFTGCFGANDFQTAWVKNEGTGYSVEYFVSWQKIADKFGAKGSTALPCSIGIEAQDYNAAGERASYSGDTNKVGTYYSRVYTFNKLNYVMEADTPEFKIVGANDRMGAYSTTAITVDGTMDAVYANGTKITFDAVGSEKDANDYAYVAFTDNDLYVFINMNDTNNDGASDFIKVYHRFHTRLSANGLYYASGAYQFTRTGVASQPNHHYNGHIPADIDLNGMGAIECKIVDNPGVGYTVEIRYPLTAAEKELINDPTGMSFDFCFEAHNGTGATYNSDSAAGSWVRAYMSSQIMPSIHLVKDTASYSIVPQLLGATVSLGEDISMKYYAMLSPLDADAQLRVTFNDKVYLLNAKKTDVKNQYVFVFEGIPPQCMGDNIKAEIIVDGKVAANVDKYSVLENCQHVLGFDTTSDEAKQLIYDLFAYGAAAQKYAQYKTDALVNRGYEKLATSVSSIDNSDRKLSPNTITGARISAAGVYFANVNKIYAKIEINGADVSKLKATINGVAAKIEHYEGNVYIVYSKAIMVSQFDDTYTFVIHDGVDSQTLVYSVNAYTKAKIGSDKKVVSDLAKATYAYGVSAKAYVNSLVKADANITNLYDKALAFNGYVSGTNATVSTIHYTSDYISVTPGEKLYFGPCNPAQQYELQGYDSSKTLTHNIVGYGDKSMFTVESTFDNGYVIYSYVVPAGVSYIRFVNAAKYNDVYTVSREPITLKNFKKYWGEGNTLDLYSAEYKINNLYDKSAAIFGYISNTGTVTSGSHYTSHYISVFPGETIYFGPCNPNQGFHLHGYDAERNNKHAYVAKGDLKVEATFNNGYVIYSYVVPSDTYYLRIANPPAYNDIYTISREPINLKNFKEYWGEGNTLDLYPLYETYTSAAFTGKKALFLGDSICAANCESGKTYQGWSGRIALATGMTCTNKGVSGASISTSRGENVVYNHYSTVRNNSYDFIIMHGGVNDAWDSVSVGSMTSSYDPADFDVTTYAGGLENLFYYVTTEHPNAKLGYIFNFATPSFNTGRISNMTEYYTVAKQICEKWNIPYLNMYEDSNLTAALKTNTTEHLSDLLHPDTSGYDILYTYIMYWMETLPVHSTVTDAYDLETLPSEVAK